MRLSAAGGDQVRRCNSTAHEGEPDVPLSGFGKDRSQPDGLSRRCRACARAQVTGWRRANPERDQLIRQRNRRTENARRAAA